MTGAGSLPPLGRPFRILVVCTANICRSPATAALLGAGLDRVAPGAARVRSAGIAAVADQPACDVARKLVAELGPDPVSYDEHRSQPISPDLARSADMILTADRGHRAWLIERAPDVRARLFTLRQAASLAGTVGATLRSGKVPDGAPPLPPRTELADRLEWFVQELDAARGLVAPVAGWQRGVAALDADDIPDPHVVGTDRHSDAIDRIDDSVRRVVQAVAILAWV